MKELMVELFQPVLLALVTAGITALLAYIRIKLKNDKQRAIFDEVKECLLEGMAEAQEQIVRPAKVNGGKLDQSTIESAEDMAVRFAKQAATGLALKKLQDMSKGRAKSIIKQLLK